MVIAKLIQLQCFTDHFALLDALELDQVSMVSDRHPMTTSHDFLDLLAIMLHCDLQCSSISLTDSQITVNLIHSRFHPAFCTSHAIPGFCLWTHLGSDELIAKASEIGIRW